MSRTKWWDKLGKLQKYSFFLFNGGVKRVADSAGNWIEYSEAQKIVDAMQDEINELQNRVDTMAGPRSHSITLFEKQHRQNFTQDDAFSRLVDRYEKYYRETVHMDNRRSLPQYKTLLEWQKSQGFAKAEIRKAKIIADLRVGADAIKSNEPR